MSLTAQERETVINMNDEEDTALVTTYQRPLITKLRKNPAAELLSELEFDGSRGAIFKLPANLVSFRQPRKSSVKRIAAPGAADRLAKARAARQVEIRNVV
jgi:hypothetical protein